MCVKTDFRFELLFENAPKLSIYTAWKFIINISYIYIYGLSFQAFAQLCTDTLCSSSHCWILTKGIIKLIRLG
jgi:hypothetical protein